MKELLETLMEIDTLVKRSGFAEQQLIQTGAGK
jgi:hypothetical protein